MKVILHDGVVTLTFDAQQQCQVRFLALRSLGEDAAQSLQIQQTQRHFL